MAGFPELIEIENGYSGPAPVIGFVATGGTRGRTVNHKQHSLAQHIPRKKPVFDPTPNRQPTISKGAKRKQQEAVGTTGTIWPHMEIIRPFLVEENSDWERFLRDYARQNEKSKVRPIGELGIRYVIDGEMQERFNSRYPRIVKNNEKKPARARAEEVSDEFKDFVRAKRGSYEDAYRILDEEDPTLHERSENPNSIAMPSQIELPEMMNGLWQPGNFQVVDMEPFSMSTFGVWFDRDDRPTFNREHREIGEFLTSPKNGLGMIAVGGRRPKQEHRVDIIDTFDPITATNEFRIPGMPFFMKLGEPQLIVSDRLEN